MGLLKVFWAGACELSNQRLHSENQNVCFWKKERKKDDAFEELAPRAAATAKPKLLPWSIVADRLGIIIVGVVQGDDKMSVAWHRTHNRWSYRV